MGVIIGMKLDDIKSILSRAGKMQFPENRDAVRALGADSMVLILFIQDYFSTTYIRIKT